jgi:hypothetical protein
MSVYISSLPVYTGTAADLRWFIMNNSGETTTYKYSGYTSGVRPGTMNSTSFASVYYPAGSVSSVYSGILGGEANTITSTDANGRNTIIICKNHLWKCIKILHFNNLHFLSFSCLSILFL